MPAPDGKAADRAAPGGRTVELIAGLLSLVWVAAVLAYVFLAPAAEGAQRLGLAMTLLVVFLPLALIWVAVVMLRSLRELRAEAARLQTTVEAMRAQYAQTSAQVQAVAQAGGRAPAERGERKPDEVAATFTSRRDASLSVPSADRKAALAPARPDPEAEQPGLALGTPAEALRPPLSVADFILALQFPEHPDDKEGFRALRLALEDREVARLIRAAQDVLTLLSQEGIFMDDLKPELCHPDLWRRFAAGERGRGVAAVGGIRDRASLALTAARMREDTIFRDAAHHFLRTFDRVFQAFEKNAGDAELADLADTRTARAFMLFGRVAGVFD